MSRQKIAKNSFSDIRKEVEGTAAGFLLGVGDPGCAVLTETAIIILESSRSAAIKPWNEMYFSAGSLS